MHRIFNVLDKLPKRLQPKAKAALQEIMRAPTRPAAEKEIEAFILCGVRCEVSEGGRFADTGSRLLRLPGGALDSLSHE
jgi:hypothetical protein